MPRVGRLEVKPFGEESQPAFPWRVLFYCRMTPEKAELNQAIIAWMGKQRANMLQIHPGFYRDNFGEAYMDWAGAGEAMLPELRKRGIAVNLNIHTAFYFLPPEKYFATHPEWYAAQFGVRCATQICYSNREALREYADNMLAYLREHPEVEVAGVWPMDGIGFCHCLDCRGANTVFDGCMWVAEYLAEHGVTIPVEHLVYTGHSPIWPTEGMKAARNVVFQVCRQGEIYHRWVDFAREQGCVGACNFDYGFADNYAWQGSAPHAPGEVEAVMRDLAVEGSLGSAPLLMDTDSWWRGCFALHFYFRMLWDGPEPVAPLLEDYCRTHYGEAWREVRGRGECAV